MKRKPVRFSDDGESCSSCAGPMSKRALVLRSELLSKPRGGWRTWTLPSSWFGVEALFVHPRIRWRQARRLPPVPLLPARRWDEKSVVCSILRHDPGAVVAVDAQSLAASQSSGRDLNWQQLRCRPAVDVLIISRARVGRVLVAAQLLNVLACTGLQTCRVGLPRRRSCRVGSCRQCQCRPFQPPAIRARTCSSPEHRSHIWQTADIKLSLRGRAGHVVPPRRARRGTGPAGTCLRARTCRSGSSGAARGR
mmetsp:Transcript_72340/g.150928  ORF Transcript_72340/g.150928 Transcript_72340/m.150928 type:complete len:251 (+) Transcript_72340:229-981(+)